MRLVREAWFNPSDPLIAGAVGATERDGLLELYDEALRVISWVAANTLVAEEELQKGKRMAKKKIKAKADAAKSGK